ncbi:MAG: OmpH family outer membrane protein [Alphaproteobacteria bacterium]|nr:OmpH family outer membrane protein [Alphaproteobacteria bacterium]
MTNEIKKMIQCDCSCKKKAAILGGAVIVAALLAFGACRLACCGSKTMVIDFDRVQREAVAYKSIIDQQKNYEEKVQAQFGLEAGALEQKEKDLVAKKGKISETEFKKKTLALQKEAMELQNKYRFQFQQILLASQTAATQIQDSVETTLQNVAEKAGAGVVLNKAVTVHVSDCNDLTDAFIKALNKSVQPVTYPNPESIAPVAGGQ